jgi:hypothetical protein
LPKTSAAVAERDSTELAQHELEASLAGQNQEEVDSSDLQIPLLKIGQPLTNEVTEGDASAGEFINALTREGLGDEVDFVVAGYQKGRFFHGDRANGRRARKAYGIKNVPWRDDPHFGEPFTEHPDAEEVYSARANAGEIEWGKGPKISTTYDFTGYVISGLGEDEKPIPVCLSLMRMNTKAAKKWATLLQAVLRGRYWDAVFHLTTERVSNAQGTFYVVNIKQGQKTTPEEKQRALGLAQVLRSRAVSVVGDEDGDGKPAAEPDAAGGMAV